MVKDHFPLSPLISKKREVELLNTVTDYGESMHPGGILKLSLPHTLNMGFGGASPHSLWDHQHRKHI